MKGFEGARQMHLNLRHASWRRPPGERLRGLLPPMEDDPTPARNSSPPSPDTKPGVELALSWLLEQKRDVHKVLVFAAESAHHPAIARLWRFFAMREARSLRMLEEVFGPWDRRRGWGDWWRWWAAPDNLMWRTAGSIVTSPGFPLGRDDPAAPPDEAIRRVLHAKEEWIRRLRFLAELAEGPMAAGLLSTFAEMEERDRRDVLSRLGEVTGIGYRPRPIIYHSALGAETALR